ncbi:MAG: hypothetical protein RBT11_09305 [Desulfobacterales bacterium]|nr:hypothetical protein [Desulfobacterales bacterium]
MSIRLIALEIYRLMREADKLSAQIEQAPLMARARLEERLRVVQAELNAMRRALAGAIEKKD